ncbi:MAG: hypothetical protein HZC47_08625 [Methanobacterium sp.]|uniref:Swt1 family HEPN domain-containing protein n=1 Tax=Methanobacterium sp. TaxID=2164 RepID=UPI003D6557EE|nr:hypothetical protein [Methanobacterium sp.]
MFNYEEPDSDYFLEFLKRYLDLNGKNELFGIVKDSKCDLKCLTVYSQNFEAFDKSLERRWDAFGAEITFHVPMASDKKYEITDNVKIDLLRCCNDCLDDERGFDILNINFMPLMGKLSPIEELKRTVSEFSVDLNGILPPEMKKKGREMAELYLYLYYVENSLRLFIENIAKNEFGDNYFDQLSGNTSINKNVDGRKQKENKNKWLGVRGDSDLFYLDFGDLNKIIVNNWDVFKQYFPDQSWITTKIKEMEDCRHLVAHNSFVDDHGRTVIKTNYISILKQLNEVLSE